MDNIEIRLLRGFMVLMRERSISRTAERLGLSQPAASHMLARLRTLFDDPLLTRSRAGMIPTERALEIERSIRGMLAEYDELVMRADRFDPALSQRTFIITAPELGERVLVPHLFHRLRAIAPHVRVEIRQPDPDHAHEMLESGEIDFRVAWLRRPVASLRSIPLFQDKMVCIAAIDHPTIRGGELTVDQFITLPHARTLTLSQATSSRVIDEAVARIGRKLERPFLVQNLLTIPTTLVGTDIIASMPLTQAQVFAQQYPLQILEPPLKMPRIRYSAFWHERSHNDPGHRWLRSILKEAGATFRSWNA
jgi:DNA-binding transcriptional LysR family regulator